MHQTMDISAPEDHTFSHRKTVIKILLPGLQQIKEFKKRQKNPEPCADPDQFHTPDSKIGKVRIKTKPGKHGYAIYNENSPGQKRAQVSSARLLKPVTEALYGCHSLFPPSQQ